MESFAAFFYAGYLHIADINSYDHLLFLLALCAIYRLRDWRTLLVTVSCFTLGHSASLSLSALRLVEPPAALIEFLIPLTIFLTATYNIAITRSHHDSALGSQRYAYIPTLLFGLIHGLGFANDFRFLTTDSSGQVSELWQPLLWFTVGIEIGQIVVISIIIAIREIMALIPMLRPRHWIITISSIAAIMSALMMFERL